MTIYNSDFYQLYKLIPMGRPEEFTQNAIKDLPLIFVLLSLLKNIHNMYTVNICLLQEAVLFKFYLITYFLGLALEFSFLKQCYKQLKIFLWTFSRFSHFSTVYFFLRKYGHCKYVWTTLKNGKKNLYIFLFPLPTQHSPSILL